MWGSCGVFVVKALQKLKIRVTRIFANNTYNTPAANLMSEMNWQSLQNMVKQEMATFVSKSISDLSSIHFTILFVKKFHLGDNRIQDIVRLTCFFRERKRAYNGQKRCHYVDQRFGMN